VIIGTEVYLASPEEKRKWSRFCLPPAKITKKGKYTYWRGGVAIRISQRFVESHHDIVMKNWHHEFRGNENRTDYKVWTVALCSLEAIRNIDNKKVGILV